MARLEASLSVEDGDFDSIDHDFNRPHKHNQQPQEVPVSIVASIDANAQDRCVLNSMTNSVLCSCLLACRMSRPTIMARP